MRSKKSIEVNKDRDLTRKPAVKKAKLDFRVTDELKEAIDVTASRLKLKPTELCIEILSRAVEVLAKGKKLEELFDETHAPTKKSDLKLASTMKASTKKASTSKTEALKAGSESATVVIYAEPGVLPREILNAQKRIQEEGDNARVVFADGEYNDDAKNEEVIESLKGRHKVLKIHQRV